MTMKYRFMQNKKISYIITLSLVVWSLNLSGQNLHDLTQFEGTEKNVSDFFLKNGYNSTDTLYIVLLPPMGCPRCEGLINPFFKKLKEVNPNIKTLLIAFYPLSSPLESYFDKRKFSVDNILVDTKESFLENFSLSTPNLQVPLFTKIIVNKGEILRIEPSLGINLNDELTLSFLNNNSVKNKTLRKNENSNKPIEITIDLESYETNVLKFNKIEPILSTFEKPISILYSLKFSQNKFISTNDLTQSNYLFIKYGDVWNFKQDISPTEFENKLFIEEDIPDSIYLFCKYSNILNSMFFNSSIFKDTISTSASLPHLFWVNKKEEEIGYENVLLILTKKLNNEYLKHYEFPSLGDKVSFDHTNTIYLSDNNIIIPVSKGWPNVGTSSELPSNDSLNPFKKVFYKNSPFLYHINLKSKIASKYSYGEIRLVLDAISK